MSIPAHEALGVVLILVNRAQPVRHLAIFRMPGRPFFKSAGLRPKEEGVSPKRQNSRI